MNKNSSRKYNINSSEAQALVLPNKLGITTVAAIEVAEFEGFLYAYQVLFEELSDKTVFDLKYIKQIHLLSLGHLYSFAGKYRTVNISKGGFAFAPALYLEQGMGAFETEFLKTIPKARLQKNEFIEIIARIHGELLFLHPFREGNGRTSRLLANLMSVKEGYGLLDLENFKSNKFDDYVRAVQQASLQNYKPMESIFGSLI